MVRMGSQLGVDRCPKRLTRCHSNATFRAWLEEKGQWGWATEAPESQQRGGGAPRAVNTEKKLRKKVRWACYPWKF